MNRSILVTGGAGFIGSHLVDALEKAGHDVRVLDSFHPQVHPTRPEYLRDNVEYIQGDVHNPDDLARALRDIEVIYHEAALVGVGQSMYQIHDYVDANVGGTAQLLDYLANKDHEVRRLLVASSMSLYGEGRYSCTNCGIVSPPPRPEGQLKAKQWEMKCPSCARILAPFPTDEAKPAQCTSIYAQSKKDQEEYCLLAGKAYGIPTVALRYFNTYGPRQSLSNPYTGVCAIFQSRIKNQEPPLIYEDGRQTRDFVAVEDIVQANLLALEKPAADYEVFNVGTGRPTSVLEVCETLAVLYKSKVEPQVENAYRVGDIRHCYADISKIQRVLGYKPKVSLQRGLGKLVQWGQKAPAKDTFEKAARELAKRGLIRR